nr:homeobox-leucine zipper protein HAT4 [Ipomoea batatas]
MMAGKEKILGFEFELELSGVSRNSASATAITYLNNTFTAHGLHLQSLPKSPWGPIFPFLSVYGFADLKMGDRSRRSRTFVEGDSREQGAGGHDAEEESGVSSPNSTISSVSRDKRSERRIGMTMKPRETMRNGRAPGHQ